MDSFAPVKYDEADRPVDILREWAWRKVNLRQIQSEAWSNPTPENCAKVRPAIIAYRHILRKKRALDAAYYDHHLIQNQFDKQSLHTQLNMDKTFTALRNFAGHLAPTPDAGNHCQTLLDTIKPALSAAPASTSVRFHHARPGGLVEHILDVYEIELETAKAMPVAAMELSPWNLFLAAVIHDLHKACDWSGRAYYVNNFLKSGKQSDAIPYQSNSCCFSFNGLTNEQSDPALRVATQLLQRNLELIPGGELSLALVAVLAPQLYRDIPECVKFAVRHHEGMYSSVRRELAGKETPLQMVLHFADMVSSRREGWLADKPQ